MTLETISFILGAILLAVSLLGGGIESKGFKIPEVSRLPRILSGFTGIVFILLGLWIGGVIPGGKGQISPAPDLIIESLTHLPTSPTTEDTITFTAVVKNAGGRRAENSILGLKIGGDTFTETYPVPALEPGETHTIKHPQIISVTQDYLNTATADFENKVSESNENNNQKTDEVRVKAPGVFSHGTVVIRGTWSCDLDVGKETQTDADFFWQQKTKTIRSVVPRNGARFYVLGRRDFDSINYNDLTRLRYSSAEINGSNNASNQIPQGTVVAAITSKGRYCKFRIDAYGYNIGISWVTYSKAE